ncbi:MAG: DUF1353 domain-containing protein [Hydrogenophaga sp.]|uniref:DUF1353 domain-containing protein n=1 Tax=Hydrogenophaga sp. TaxID=1904254 RepID=UPI0026196E66|nr:DUF1353 domain-containing protein [Hydrogenophaga sp.]MCV0441463.1 DUF1353 domain-containing protein [Hydrogenophaga sp.]
MPFDDRTPHLELQADGETFRLLKPVRWTPRANFAIRHDLPPGPLRVPAGFVTDFASVPRLFRSLVPRAGRYSLATFVHDWLYRAQPEGWTRKKADLAFLSAMRDLGVPWLKRRTIYHAVRIGGGRW